MIKLLVETRGAFQLVDLGHKGQMVRAQRPCVVENSNFIQDRIGRNQVRILSPLKPEATDGQFEEYVRDSENDLSLAVEAFLSTFGEEAVEQEGKSAKEGGRKRKPKVDKAEPTDGGE